jgi:hypothetical protein
MLSQLQIVFVSLHSKCIHSSKTQFTYYFFTFGTMQNRYILTPEATKETGPHLAKYFEFLT